MNPRSASQQNSTIGRSVFTILSWAAPAQVERLAVELFCRPRRLPRPTAPTVSGLEPHRFVVSTRFEQLAAWDWGHGPTVLLVHGWNGLAAQLSPFVAPLVAAGYYVVAFDQPAHGASSGARATLLDLTHAVEAVARKVGPLHGLIAHSLGATATTLAIARGLPVERAVLLAPPADVNHFARAFASQLGLSTARAEGMRERLRLELGGDLGAFDLRRLAPSLRTPVLVMHDPHDREVPFAHGRALAESWPGARFEALRSLGHRRLLSDPAVIDLAVAFVHGTDASAARRSA
jgi:pimeloyl-ACP methyl ester carboxylesterase